MNFFSLAVGVPIEARNFNTSWDARSAAAGTRKITVHDGRRTCATLLVDIDVLCQCGDLAEPAEPGAASKSSDWVALFARLPGSRGDARRGSCAPCGLLKLATRNGPVAAH